MERAEQAVRSALVAADQAPGRRQQAGPQHDLERVADEERHQAILERVAQADLDREPGQAQRIDHEIADYHRSTGLKQRAIPAALGKAAADRGRNHEADEIAARRAIEKLDVTAFAPAAG